MKGDCLERMLEIEDGSVDLILTDPPYGTTSCKWDSVIPLDVMWEQLKRIIKPNGAIVLTASQPFTTVLINSNMKGYKHNYVWHKSRSGSAITAKYCPVKIHEDVIVFERNGKRVNYYPQMEAGTPYKRVSKYNNNNDHKFGISDKVITFNEGTRYPQTVRAIPQNWSKQQQLHPTQKPVALMEYMIKSYTQEGETVLDFTMGSGTTGVACVNLNRGFIGIEQDSDYFDIAVKRISDAQEALCNIDAITSG